MKFSPFDEAAMRRALELAARGLYSTQPNPRVGAVLARDEEVVGEGWHERAGEPHAEPIAVRAAGDRARGATAYVTLEPCCHHGRTPPCVDVLLAAGIRRVVYAVADPNPRVNGGGAKLLKEAGVIVQSGLLAADAEALNAGFMMRMRRGRPFVRLKTGASLDGRTALANGASRWITSEEARADVQHWRAQSGAVLTTADTVLADDPRLDVRIDAPRQPLRVVLDRRRRLRKNAKIFRPPGDVLMFSAARTRDVSANAKAKRLTGASEETVGAARIERVRVKRTHLDLERVFSRLAELEINDVLVESGPRFAGALFTAGLVDEWLLYVAPTLLGKDARPLVVLPRISKLSEATAFELRESTQIGPDLRLRLVPRTQARPSGRK
jgi:diaminohydroxyphosphoribosylaminopyrimidine deaminase / 5-amino-6-(5-phosphoribosylamino)uracil reductase